MRRLPPALLLMCVAAAACGSDDGDESKVPAAVTDSALANYAEDGPEGLINAWPLDENYIDYTRDAPTAGLINDLTQTLSKETIANANGPSHHAGVSGSPRLVG